MTPPNPAVSLRSIAHVILYVKDMERSVRFYRDLLGIPVRFTSPDWTELETEGVTLALHATDRPLEHCAPSLPEISFTAPDVRAAWTALREAGTEIKDLRQVCEIPPAQVGLSAKFHDPDGNHLSLFGVVPRGA